MDYYICVQSTNAKKGGSAYYTVTVKNWTEIENATAALSMPEEDLGMSESLNGLQDSLETLPAGAISDAAASVSADILRDDGLLRQDSGLLA